MESLETESYWPYSERNGVGIEQDVSLLLSDPEVRLSTDELESAYAFANGLFFGKLNENLTCDSLRNLEEIDDAASLDSERSFYIGYFTTLEGRTDLARLGLKPLDLVELVSMLNDIEFINVTTDENDLKKVAINSLNWQKVQLARSLLGDAKDDQKYEDAEPLRVNYSPDKLLDKLEDLQAYRRFYRLVRAPLKNLPKSNLVIAKTALLDVYQGRVNSILADIYPATISLAEQLVRTSDQEDSKEYSNRLAIILPTVHEIFIADSAYPNEFSEYILDSFVRRLDLIRNGVGKWDGHNLSPIANAVLNLAEELDKTDRQPKLLPEIPVEVVEKLKSVVWNANQVADFAKVVLTELGIFSQYCSTWQEATKRDGPPEDHKWQVIIHPKKKSFAIDAKKRVLFLPEEYSRSLSQVDPPGTLPLFAHELTHILQNEQSFKSATNIPLAKIKGRRFVTTREFNAIAQESKLDRLFGNFRPINTRYLRSLQVKLAGGNKLEVARTFYDIYVRDLGINDKVGLSKAREFSADRVMRLYRFRGQNSQPLDYIEQELIGRAITNLPEAQQSALLNISNGYSLKDAVKLHQAGLLQRPNKKIIEGADITWQIFTHDFLPQL